MGWAGQTWMRITQEGTGGTNYGTFNASAIAAQILVPTLIGGNPFTMRKTPIRQIIRTADAGNRRKFVVAPRSGVAGGLNTILHPDQAAFWMTAATGLTSNLLPSYTIDYWDSVQAHRFLGCEIQTLRISSTAQTDYLTLAISWIGQKRDATFTTFSAPAETEYSTLVPYQHFESAGHITLGGSAITKYKNVDLTIGNVMAPTWDELQFISALYYCGRDFDFTFGPQYLATPLRGDLETQAALTFVLNWTRVSPAHALTIDCKTASFVSTVDDDLPLDGAGYQSVGVQTFFDATNTTDFAVTVT